MGKLIIDGSSVFEIDEECLKKKQIPKNCDIEKYISKDIEKRQKKQKNNAAK